MAGPRASWSRWPPPLPTTIRWSGCRSRKHGLRTINCAHGDPRTWAGMIENVRKAETETGRPCSVAMDRAGPKLHTAAVNDDQRRLRTGDDLLLDLDPAPNRQHHAQQTARTACTLPEALRTVQAGQQIWFDDGKIGTVVTEATPHHLHLRVAAAGPKGTQLRAGKGINLPDGVVVRAR